MITLKYLTLINKMTKKDLQKLYDRLLIENEAYKNFIRLTNGQQALDKIDMEVAIALTNDALEHSKF